MNTVRRAVGFSVLAQYYAFGIQFVSIMIVSRLLTPEEIGTYSVAAVTLLAASWLRTFGTGAYIVQAPKLDRADMRQATGVVTLMSVGVTTLLVLFADRYAEFFGVPRLAEALTLIGFCYLFTPLVSIPVALHQRRLDMIRAQGVAAASATAQTVVTIVCAYSGAGFMSMAYGLAAGMMIEVLVATIFRPTDLPWLPSFSRLAKVFTFGGLSSLGALAQELSRGVPDLVLGRTSTMSDVGIFSRALGVVMIFDRIVTMAVSPAVLPHLSRENREGYSVSEAYQRAVSLQTGIAWGFFAAFSSAVLPIVRVLYGDQWDSSVAIAEILITWACIAAVFSYNREALVSVGRLTLALIKEAIGLSARVVLIIIAVAYGLETVAIAIVAVGVMELVITTWFLNMAIGLRPLDLVRACIRSAFVATLPLAVCHGLSPWIYSEVTYELVQVIIFVTLGICSWLIGLYLFKHPLRHELERVLSKASEVITSFRTK